jgi:hypothetical protein
MHVRVEETGHDGATAKVDGARGRAKLARLPDVDDAAVLDRQRRADDTAAVDEFAVREKKIGLPCGRPSLCRLEVASDRNTRGHARDRTRDRTFQQLAPPDVVSGFSRTGIAESRIRDSDVTRCRRQAGPV